MALTTHLPAAASGYYARTEVHPILDVCHAGDVMSGTNDDAVDTLITGDGPPASILSASKGRQYSREGAEYHGGAFTPAFVASLTGQRALADMDGNGVLDFEEVYVTLKRRVGNATGVRQTPWFVRRGTYGPFPSF